MAERGGRRGRGRGRARGNAGSDDAPIVGNIDVLNEFRGWAKLTQIGDHAINYVDTDKLNNRFRMCGGKAGVCEAYRVISEQSPKLKAIIDRTGWQHVCLVNEMRHDNKLVDALIERWWPTTHTFHLPQMEVGFTPYDLAAITGVSCEGELVTCQQWPRNGAKQLKAHFFLQVFPMLADHAEAWYDIDVRGISVQKIGTMFDGPLQLHLEDPNEEELSVYEVFILRMFFLYVIGTVWFPNSKGLVYFPIVHTVLNVELVHTYDWGSAILAQLYHAFDECATLKTFKFQGCWSVLQVNLFIQI